MKFTCIVFALLLSLCNNEELFSRDHSYFEGQLLVQLEKGAEIAKLRRAFDEYNIRPLEEVSKPMRIWLIEFDTLLVPTLKLMRLMYEHSLVKVAQTNHRITLRSTIPNDASFSSQWHHLNSGLSGGNADSDIDSDEAWDISTGGLTASGDEIVVCIIEGADLSHPDLAANAWINSGEIQNNNIDDDGNGYIDDYYGWNVSSNDDNVYSGSHGTQVAGMIGATGNNNLGVSGANWSVKLMVVAGQSTSSEASVIAAYTYPWIMRKKYNASGGTEGAFVVATNASWGIDGGDPASAPLWCAFYDSLGEAGILNCGATANNSVDVDIVGDLPTACPSDFMISVTATDNTDTRTFSAYGSTTIDLGAPGASVYTTSSGGGYGSTSGTSFASPLTAGVIGLLYSVPCPSFMAMVNADPKAASLAVRQALFGGVDLVGNLPGNTVTGGRLNAFNSLNILNSNFGCSNVSACQTPSGLSASLSSSSSANLSWNPVGSSMSYELEFRQIGATYWNSNTVSATNFTLTNLLPCSQYEFRVRAVCDSSVSIFSSTVNFNTGGCGNCTSSTYCLSNGSNNSEEWISNVSIGPLNNSSGAGSGGYTDFTSNIVTFFPGDTYPVALSPAYSSTTYSEYFRVWIDYNQDGDFEDAGELAFGTGISTTSTINGFLTIPVNALSGSTRMRVSMKWNSDPTPCEAFSYGEVEDYCIVIADTVECQVPDSIYTNGIYYNSAVLNWSPVTSADHFTIRGRQSGTSAFIVLNIPGGNTNSLNVSGLFPGKSYEWQIMTGCNVDGSNSSHWTNLTSFTTLNCSAPANLSTSNITGSAARLNWDPVSGAIGYKIQGRQVGSSALVSLSISGGLTSFFDVGGLSANTSYEWKIRATCPGGYSSYSNYSIFSTVGNQLSSKKQNSEEIPEIMISPNPSNGILSVEIANNTDDIELDLYDLGGRKIMNKTMNASSITMHLNGISTGIYQLVLSGPEFRQVRKVIIAD